MDIEITSDELKSEIIEMVAAKRGREASRRLRLFSTFLKKVYMCDFDDIYTYAICILYI